MSVSHVCKQLGRTPGALAGAGVVGGDADAAGELGAEADPAGTEGCTGELGPEESTPGDGGAEVVGGATHLVQMVDVEVLMTVETVTVGLPLTVMGHVVTVVYALRWC